MSHPTGAVTFSMARTGWADKFSTSLLYEVKRLNMRQAKLASVPFRTRQSWPVADIACRK